MASGSQTWSGNWALLPTQPAKIPRPANRQHPERNLTRQAGRSRRPILTLWLSGSTSWTTSAAAGRRDPIQLARRTAQPLVDLLEV